ncbi:MAG: T9SS type A sorting domain-containing protein [Candidatus Kapabacteria bacterium]|nr:T9SS type A sorting domain-containing protein [Candidatus Kapabacteria bacterium]
MKTLRHYSLAVLLVACLASVINLHAGSTPTFAEDIAPIIWKNCVNCHRAGEIAPFALTTYKDNASRAAMLKFVTADRTMPPWKPTAGYGKFSDARGLTQEQIDKIAAWADAGAPMGDESKLPPLPVFNEGSQLGKPDLILTMEKSWKQPGTNQDVYRNFVLPTGLLENKTIAAIEFRPDNKRIVHHALYFLDTTGAARKLDANDTAFGYSGFSGPGFNPTKSLLGWVPGATPRFFPKGMGIPIYKNSDIVIQIHYAPSPVEEEDRSSLNIFFAKEPSSREIFQAQIGREQMTQQLIIPANTVRSFEGTIKGTVIARDISLLGIAPHMHLLGKDCRSFAVTPNKDTIPLVKIDSWDFNWQGFYMFKNPVKIPRGSTLYYQASYNNTEDNPENPNNPPKLVTWGESTFDEMFLNYFIWTLYQNGDENIIMDSNPTSVENELNPLQKFTLHSVMPNPASNSTTVRCEVSADAIGTLRIVDMSGKQVQAPIRVEFNSGMNDIPLTTSALSAGRYVVECSIGSRNVFMPFSVVR